MPQKSELPPTSSVPSAQIRIPGLLGEFQTLFLVYSPERAALDPHDLAAELGVRGADPVEELPVRDRALLEAVLHVVLERVLADELLAGDRARRIDLRVLLVRRELRAARTVEIAAQSHGMLARGVRVGQDVLVVAVRRELELTSEDHALGQELHVLLHLDERHERPVPAADGRLRLDPDAPVAVRVPVRGQVGAGRVLRLDDARVVEGALGCRRSDPGRRTPWSSRWRRSRSRGCCMRRSAVRGRGTAPRRSVEFEQVGVVACEGGRGAGPPA